MAEMAGAVDNLTTLRPGLIIMLEEAIHMLLMQPMAWATLGTQPMGRMAIHKEHTVDILWPVTQPAHMVPIMGSPGRPLGRLILVCLHRWVRRPLKHQRGL